MRQDTDVTDWMTAYLGWTESDYRAITQPPQWDPALATNEEIAAAYLEWIDATSAHASREAILLTALRAESDCVRVLRQLLELALTPTRGALRECEIEQQWPHALEAVAADMRALKGELMAMRVH